jgi:penicillin amidase
VYSPDLRGFPVQAIDAASNWEEFRQALSQWWGPTQNVAYADDQGHIGYHAVGRVPVRGSFATPTAISPLPTDGLDAAQEWAGYIPFDAMPQSFDPAGGVAATANARVVPEDYRFPITLDWADPYRNERIWKVLGSRSGLVPSDMIALQTDVYSDLDRVIAQRLVYAIDHTQAQSQTAGSARDKRLRQAADLLRVWDGTVAADSSAAAIVDAARTAFWPMILSPQLGVAEGAALDPKNDPLRLYGWGEKDYAEEQIIMHSPARWLPVKYPDWNALLTAAVEKGMVDGKAPSDLTKWKFGAAHPVDIEHPVFSQSPLLATVLGIRTGTGVEPQSGDDSTVKQVRRRFGPSERLTVDFSDLDRSTLNVVLGESANPDSAWFLDQWQAWYRGTTFAMPFSEAAVSDATKHTVTLVP